MEIRWLGEVCSALPSSGGRGHSCDHQAMPLIETLYVVETLYAICNIWTLRMNGASVVASLPLTSPLITPSTGEAEPRGSSCVLYDTYRSRRARTTGSGRAMLPR